MHARWNAAGAAFEPKLNELIAESDDLVKAQFFWNAEVGMIRRHAPLPSPLRPPHTWASLL